MRKRNNYNYNYIFGINTYGTSTGDPSILPTATGKIGIGVVNPTANLEIAASTTASALMKLNVGPAPTSPNNGDVWLESNGTTGLKIRLNGVTENMIGSAAPKEAYIQLQFYTDGSASVSFVQFNSTDTPTYGINKLATGRYLITFNNANQYIFTPEGFLVHGLVSGAAARIMMHHSSNQLVFRDSSTGNLVDPGTTSGTTILVNVLLRQIT